MAGRAALRWSTRVHAARRTRATAAVQISKPGQGRQRQRCNPTLQPPAFQPCRGASIPLGAHRLRGLRESQVCVGGSTAPPSPAPPNSSNRKLLESTAKQALHPSYTHTHKHTSLRAAALRSFSSARMYHRLPSYCVRIRLCVLCVGC